MIVKSISYLVLGIILVTSSCARDEPLGATDHSTFPPGTPDGQPIVVINSYGGNFWNPSPSGESPICVVYGDGTVIVFGPSGDEFEYRTVKLDPRELEDLLQRANLRALAPYDGVKDFALRSGTDAGSSVLIARQPDGTITRIPFYGAGVPDPANENTAAYPPPPIVNALTVLLTFTHPRSVSWTPDEFEVYLWETGPMQGSIGTWPKDWPNPEVAPSIRQFRVVRVGGADSARLSTLLGTPTELHAKMVRSRRYIWCATYRPVFPGEEHWRREYNVATGGS